MRALLHKLKKKKEVGNMLTNIAKLLGMAAVVIGMAAVLTGCGNQGLFKDPWHGFLPAISHSDDNAAVIVPDQPLDENMVKAPDYEILPGDVIVPTDNIDYL